MRTLAIFPEPAIVRGYPRMIESAFSRLLASRTYSPLTEDLFRLFIRTIGNEVNVEFLTSTYAPVFLSKPLEVKVYAHAGPRTSRLTGNIGLCLGFAELADPPTALQPLSEGACLLTSAPSEVNSVGATFFSKTICNRNLFHSTNPNLMESIYFPVQLAENAEGLFFEERIINRLLAIGFLPDNVQIDLIADEGGWETLDQLTAVLTISYRTGDQRRKLTLLGTAVVPPPPVTPEALCKLIERRNVFLRQLGIRSVILRAENGVVYHKKVVPLIEVLGLIPKGNQRLNLLSQCAKVAGIIDVNFWKIPHPELDSIGSWNQVTDIIDISDSEEVAFHRNFLEAFGVYEDDLYWMEIRRSPIAFRGPKAFAGSWCWEKLSDILAGDERSQIYPFYLQSKRADRLVH